MNKILYTIILFSLLSVACAPPIGHPLKGSEWVIMRYENALATAPSYPNDTLFFETTESYRINGGTLRNYSTEDLEENKIRINFYDLTTLGSDFSLLTKDIFIQDGILNNVHFQNLNVADTLPQHFTLVWMEKR